MKVVALGLEAGISILCQLVYLAAFSPQLSLARIFPAIFNSNIDFTNVATKVFGALHESTP